MTSLPVRKLFVALPLGLVALLALGLAAASAITGQEWPLTAGGVAFEINRDASGDFWISDAPAGQVWRVHPATGDYTVYGNLPRPVDARPDNAGAVWWTGTVPPGNYFTNVLGRIIPGTGGTVTTWTLAHDGALSGPAIDAAGQVWALDGFPGTLYRVTPGTPATCTNFAAPGAPSANYLLASGNQIWLGDNSKGRILRFMPGATNNTFTVWQLPPNATPVGLALAANGDLWWADAGLAELDRLDPKTNLVTRYALPAPASPEMIVLDQSRVWYTNDYNHTIGVLDPGVAAHTELAVTPTAVDVAAASCPFFSEGAPAAASTTTGTFAAAAAVTYPRIPSSAGWMIYQLPTAGTPAMPWGIAAGSTSGQPWAVDAGRQKVIQLLPQAAISIDKKTNGLDDGGFVAVGSAVNWTYLVTNTGDVALSSVSVTDDRGVTVSCPKTTLAVDESMTCTASGTAVAGQYTNTGTATGTGAAPDSRTVSASDTSKYFGSQPALTLDKRTNGGDGLSISAGAALTWTYAVTNTGNVELTNVKVTDNKLTAGEIHCGGAAGANVIAKLAPSAAGTCTAAGVAVLGPYENLGTATGTPPVGAEVTATDASSYTGIENKHYLFLPMLRR